MKLTISGNRSYLWQWDSGQQLLVEDAEQCHEVHFSLRGDTRALVVPIKEHDGRRVVNVPNILLQTSGRLQAYLFANEADTLGATLYYTAFTIKARPQPEDYVYTETEVLDYSFLDQRLTYLEGEGLAKAIADYLKENPSISGGFVASDVPPEDTSVLWVDIDDNEVDDLQEVIDEALAQAKASGEFDGKDGYTPEKGKDYFTDADKQEIADQAAGMVKIPDGVELDTTLTASGKAADAKAVGDALNGKLSKSGGTMTGKIVFPTADQNAGFANSEDMKIFGYGTFNGAMHMRMGDTQYPFQIRGNGDRPKYNEGVIALMGDIPTDAHINSLINTALGVIENGTY